MGSRTRHFGVLIGAWLLGAGCSGQVNGGGPGSGGTGNPGSGGGAAVGGPGSGGTGQGGTGGGIITGGGGAGTVACSPLQAIPRRLWRLSAPQYANAARDLLGLTTIPTVDSTADGVAASAFFSDVSLTVQPSFEYSLYQTAENVLAQIASRIPAITTASGCTTGQAPAACATVFAQNFGLKAFRRPLAATEVTNLMNVYTQGALQDFNTGISLMIEALLLSPSFMYRTELGPTTLVADATGKFPDTTLTPYEVATQLGFLLLNSTPDAPLLAAAAAPTNGLGTTAGITAQVARLLGSTAVKSNLTNITFSWFNLGQIFTHGKDVTLLSSLAAADQTDQSGLQGDLIGSAQLFINDVLFTNPTGKIVDLLTSQKVFLTQRLATLYKLPYTGTTANPFGSTTWPATQNRSGMLTQPGFLWAISDPSRTSIVKRGKYIHDDIVCQDPGPEPPTSLAGQIAAALMMYPDETSISNYRVATQPCQSCHQNIDPYSRTLQNFGPIGDYRTMADGVTVDPTGSFPVTSPIGSQTVTGAPAMMQALIASKVFTGCAVQKMLSYTLGNMIRTYNTCEVQTLRTQFDQSDGTMSSLFNQLVAANFVRARAGGMQ